MRLTDLLRPHLDGVTTVVDATPGALDLEPYLHLPDGVTLTREPDAVGEGTLVLLSHGPDTRLHGTESAVLAVLERMRPGGRGLIVLGHRVPELPYHRLLDALVAHHCQVLRAAPLDYTHLHAGAVFTRTDRLLPPDDWSGRPVPAEGFATALRIADEYVLADLVSRALRTRVLDLERAAGERATEGPGTGAADGLAERLAAAERERAQLSAALRGARDRVEVLQARVAMLEGSTSLRVGKALVSAARSPKRGATRLPKELYGLWRTRTTPTKAAPTTPSAPTTPTGTEADLDGGRLHLAHRAFTSAPRDRLVLAGVFTDPTATAFAADAVVNRTLPHDAEPIVARTDPDAVVVQLTACTGYGPWAHTGTGFAPDLDRRLNDLLTAARTAGRACVLWRDGPASAAPGLTRFAWDAVLDTDTGTPLTDLDPATDGRDRLREVFRTGGTRVRLAELARRVGAPDPLAARRVAVVADPRDRADIARLTAQVLGQAHRPAEVVVPDPAGLGELIAAGITVRTGTPLAPWIADWTDDPAEDRPDTLLLDLLCAQEYSGADAVGSTPAGDDYTFVPELRPLLVSRELYVSGDPPELWARRGHRLFACCGKEPA
ncbi:hypothetical protein AB0O01_04285 [Streptomyces sp. NPDC093252]|uniref:hypothetical protein n=1 Tax=Streptomyces sp. NPDC093252 TaxID=3154980 RepID=UPI00342F9FBC